MKPTFPSAQVSAAVLSHGASQRTQVKLANQSYWDYGYDALGQVTSGKHRWPDASLVQGQQFE